MLLLNSDEVTSSSIVRRYSEIFLAGILRLSGRGKKDSNNNSDKATK